MNRIKRALGIGLLVLGSLPFMHQSGASAHGVSNTPTCVTIAPITAIYRPIAGTTYVCGTGAFLPGTVTIFEDGTLIASVPSVLIEVGTGNQARVVEGYQYTPASTTLGTHTFTVDFSPSAVGFADSTATSTVTIP